MPGCGFSACRSLEEREAMRIGFFLFLTGFLLFVFSLLFTTAADVVSRRFRRQDA